MRQSPMLCYPVAEFETRMANAAQKIKDAGLTCIMGSTKAVVCYLTGLSSVVWCSKAGTPGLMYLGADGHYGVMNSYTSVDAALYSTCMEPEDFFNYDYSGRNGIATNLFDAMCYTLRHFGYDKGKIGCELGAGFHLHMPLSLYESLKKEFPELEFVDASELIWDILSEKSEAQIADCREAEAINLRAVAAGMEYVKPGAMTEMELYKEIAKAGYLAGSEHFTYMSLVSGAERSLCVGCPPSETELISAEPGTVIRVEGAAKRHELNVPFAANLVVGGVQAAQASAWELAQGMIDAALSAVRAGASAGSVAEAMDAFAAASGRSDWVVQPGFAGSGFGWGRVDGPLLRAGSEYVLRPGMTLSLTASVRSEAVGMLILRQNVVVTAEGCEFLGGKTTEPLIV